MRTYLERIFRKRTRTAIVVGLIADIIMAPFVLIAALILKLFRIMGVVRYFPISKNILWWVGIYPLRDHYYDPLFNPKHLRKPLSEARNLPGIEWNETEQLAMLQLFHYVDEFEVMDDEFVNKDSFYFNNGTFGTGDAEYWYNMVRLKKPSVIIEIGSANSTKLAKMAIDANTKEHADYTCRHICIEPYEMPWLEKLGVEVIRKKAEELDVSYFEILGPGDILFIDSSHIIRPQGDVVFEYLELLPTLKKGVIVHVHDIFTPRDYLEEWVKDDVRFWNEQYLLEAFLSNNPGWKIIGALNFLKHRHYDLLHAKCPKITREREPGSFYIEKL